VTGDASYVLEVYWLDLLAVVAFLERVWDIRWTNSLGESLSLWRDRFRDE
jgi:hypothetical protein